MTDSDLTLMDVPSRVLANVSDLEKMVKAGLGKVFGAGEWNELELAKREVELALARTPVGMGSDAGGVRWLGSTAPGETEMLFGRDLREFFLG